MSYLFSARNTALIYFIDVISLYLLNLLSPEAVIEGQVSHIAWLPYSFIIAQLIALDRRSWLPLTGAVLTLFGLVFVQLPLSAIFILTLSILVPLILSCTLMRNIKGSRWNGGFFLRTSRSRIVLLGFVSPLLTKLMTYGAGLLYTDTPQLAHYFYSGTEIYLFTAILSMTLPALAFTPVLYSFNRLLFSSQGVRRRFKRQISAALNTLRRPGSRGIAWSALLITTVALFCYPVRNSFFADYLVPFLFLIFIYGIVQFNSELMQYAWSATIFALLQFNQNFISSSDYAPLLVWLMSTIVVFTIANFWLTFIKRSHRAMLGIVHAISATDPLTGLPNIRSLEKRLIEQNGGALCYINMHNLYLLDKHYGLSMRLHIKRIIAAAFGGRPDLAYRIHTIPGCDLLFLLDTEHRESQLLALQQVLRDLVLSWKGRVYEMNYQLAWGHYHPSEEFNRFINKLARLAESAPEDDIVVALDEREAELAASIDRQWTLHAKVIESLKHSDILLYGQPIRTEQGEEYREILSRLRCGDEILTPDRFLPVIREFNLCEKFDLLVLEKSLCFLSKHFPGETRKRLSINIMPATLVKRGLGMKVIALFTRYRVATSCAVIEITEEQELLHSDNARENIDYLSRHGVKIAIDDFGTGMANYQRLKELKADILKIDGVFIKDILTCVVDQKIVRSICDIAKEKNMEIVAEYVETEEQRQCLSRLGVTWFQGYHIGKPVPCEP